MAIDKINFSYPKGTLQSVFDNEALTALELAAKTSKKVDECVEIVNGVEQTAIEATTIIDDMYVIQNQFVTDNSDTRAQLVNDNQQYLDGLTVSKEQFVENLNDEIETIVNTADETILTNVNNKINELITDGTINNLINVDTEKSIVEATGTGVINGLNVLPQASPNMSVLVSPGVAHLCNGKRYQLLENATINIHPADVSYSRIDIIFIDTNGILTYGKGIAIDNPTPPTPVNALILAEIWVAVGDTVINANNITDKRIIKPNLFDETNLIKENNELNTIVYMRKYANGDGTDETDKIQQAINAAQGKILYWNKQTGAQYFMNNEIAIPSNITIMFEAGTIVYSEAGTIFGVNGRVMFQIWNEENITIIGNGALLTMDKTQYLAGEWNHTINITSSKNIRIDNLHIFQNGGDGIYIGGNNTDTECRNVTVSNCVIDGSKRNGISVTYAQYVNILNCEIMNTQGTNPQYAIDVEPNAGTYAKYVNIKNCYLHDNEKGGIILALNAEKCTVDSCVSVNDPIAFTVSGSASLIGNNHSFINCIAEDASYNAFYITYGHNTHIKNCTALNSGNFGIQAINSPYSKIENCIVKNSASRGLLSQSDFMTVKNNLVYGNKEGGLLALQGANCIIEGNICEANTGTTFNFNISVALSRSIIQGNICRQGTEEIKTGIGLNITSMARNNIIVNNDCFDGGSETGLYISSSSQTINRGNILKDGSFSTSTYSQTLSYEFDPILLADGERLTSPQISFAGVLFGDIIAVIPPYNLQGIIATAFVHSTGYVKISLKNETGSPIDLASGTWTLKAIR